MVPASPVSVCCSFLPCIIMNWISLMEGGGRPWTMKRAIAALSVFYVEMINRENNQLIDWKDENNHNGCNDWSDVFFFLLMIDHLVQKCQKILKNIHHSFFKPEGTSLNSIYNTQNSPRPKVFVLKWWKTLKPRNANEMLEPVNIFNSVLLYGNKS